MLKRLLAVLVVTVPTAALAAGVDTNALFPSARPDPFAEAAKLVEAGDYYAAIPKLQAIVAGDPSHADALNYLGYSHRKMGLLEVAYDYYDKALRVEPNHMGALEYLGELHVERGEIGEAETILRRLGALCPQGCEERDELAEAIAAYRARQSGS